ncbi:MAG: hypothetical protein H6713_26265 [Myxococcales bacterium]|nr:hypothetical protein [Myxococcales bacterium]MCB9753462.1 hypothetical protein [Myxococcales bacterium]
MTQAQQQVSETQIGALLDGELSASERELVEQFLAEQPDAMAQFEELGHLRQAICDSFEEEAARVPEARFEQIWDEIERTIDNDARLQSAADTRVSIWSRLVAFMQPVWRPALAVGGVAAVAALILSTGRVTDIDANNKAHLASKTAAEAQVNPNAVDDEVKDVAADEAPSIAKAGRPEAAVPSVVGPFPQPNEEAAEIEQIEFGGNGGQIGQIEGKTGTVTVIWVTEEDDPADSERAL